MSIDTPSSSVSTQSESFNILIASDVHLGYAERHHLRGDDSFRTFEEVLQAAVKHDVDAILLAGDLFHINRPSIPSMQRASELIRKYCFGEFHDQEHGSRFKIINHKNANFMDPNLQVRYPIFTIHGNHDDPTGVQQTSVIDLLDSSGLVNYIGKRHHVEEVILSPVILQKGRTKIALYGLGSMHEERLHHLIENDKFNYMTPDDDLSTYFKLLLVHQNRIKRPNTHYLHPEDLEELPDLVVWGHEHGAVKPEYFEPCNFMIYQPGSTVATSLCDAEAGEKSYGLLTVKFNEVKQKPVFKIQMHKLETVRPFLLKTVNAEEILKNTTRKLRTEEDKQQHLYNYCKDEIKHMIQDVRIASLNTMLPLIRLRVEYIDPEQQFDAKRFGRELTEKVANPDELIRFVKRNDPMAEYRAVMDEEENFNMADMMEILDDEVVSKSIQISNIMGDYFGGLTNEKHQLGVFAEKYLTGKVVEFVEKGATDQIGDLVFNYQVAIRELLGDADELDMTNLEEEIREVKDRIESDENLLHTFDSVIQKAKAKRVLKDRVPDDLFAQDSDDNEDNVLPSTSKAGKSPASTRGRGRPRKASAKEEEDFQDSDDDGDMEWASASSKKKKSPATSTRGTTRGGGRGRGRPRKAPVVELDSDVELIEESDLDEPPPKAAKKPAAAARGGRGGRGRGRGRGRTVSVLDDDDQDEETKITTFFSKRPRRN